jgi:transposase InsO family protein
MDNGLEMVSQALQRFCDGKVGLTYIPPGYPWDIGYIESFNNRLRRECEPVSARTQVWTSSQNRRDMRVSKLGLGATTNAAEYQHVRRLADGPHSSTLTDEAYDDAKNWISFER